MSGPEHSPSRAGVNSRAQKSQAAFRTISEVADDLAVAQHVLRFWESKFPQVRPLKRGGGRRYYRPEDVEILRNIRTLLYEQGYTIKGAQKLLRTRRGRGANDEDEEPQVQGEPQAAPEALESAPDIESSLPAEARERLEALLGNLEKTREALRRALS